MSHELWISVNDSTMDDVVIMSRGRFNDKSIMVHLENSKVFGVLELDGHNRLKPLDLE